MSLLDTILKELDDVSEAEIASVEPRLPVSQLDQVLGEASSQLRRQYCLLQLLSNKLDDAEEELRYIHDGDDDFYVQSARSLKNKKDLLQDIFDASCIDAFPALFGKAITRIAIRKGWKVVWVVP